MSIIRMVQKIKKTYIKYRRIPLTTVMKKIPYRLIKPALVWKEKVWVNLRKNNVATLWIGDSFKPSCSFLFSSDIQQQYVRYMKEIEDYEAVFRAADKVCRHELNVLGSGERFLGNLIGWTVDFKTGFGWRNQFYQDIKAVQPGGAGDIKIPWELSRCCHFSILGRAYWLSGDPKYVLEFQDECTSWTEANPFKMSVNWVCPMEVAIRAMNWVAGYCFFSGSPVIPKEFWTSFFGTLYLHGRFIFDNLENRGLNTNNHYLADLCGLIWLGLFFKEVDTGKKGGNNPSHWLVWGLSELEKEIALQINPDGTDYETSTYYHGFVTEMLLLTFVFCERNHFRFSAQSRQRLERMGEFLADIEKPNGLTPIIGDADDGRIFADIGGILKNKPCQANDFRSVLAVMGEYFNRDDFRYNGSSRREEAVLLMGIRDFLQGRMPHRQSKAYRDGGFYILRNEKVYCLIRCGPLSCRGEGGHSHNDQLGVEINFGGEDIFIDPGTFVYSGDFNLRNLFRSTQSHNTLIIEGYQQNDFDPADLFFMREQTFSECLSFDEEKFIGRHFGYQKKNGAVHQRMVRIRRKGLLIVDGLSRILSAPSSVTQNFILDSGVAVKTSGNKAYLEKGNVFLVMKTTGLIRTEEFQISPAYGVLENSRRLIVENGFKDSCHSIVSIQLMEKGADCHA